METSNIRNELGSLPNTARRQTSIKMLAARAIWNHPLALAAPIFTELAAPTAKSDMPETR
ncbi:hypothetical protein [Candidatus Pelagisphaera phototrophica]|uniref:hypothetical protein n=1 Tax=Candidatus Pelagisphaera phototrophica TaxID=2684113 RepID=UPI0024B7D592|nr:hypothetical protein [Candidatus Pelagisphaera phototrophica]